MGFALALRAEVLGLDIDAGAVSTYNLNLSKMGCRARVQDVLDWEPSGDFDLIIGGPPCQPFSRVNRHERVGERHPLYPTFPRFFDVVLALQPEAFLMENVPGLLLEHGAILERQLSRVSGEYKVELAVLDAARYGVPQRRERLFVLGVRRDVGVRPSFPPPTHGPVEHVDLTGRRVFRWVTVREAIGDLPPLRPGEASGDPLHRAPRHTERVLRLISAVPREGSRRRLPPELWLECHRATDGYWDVYGRLRWDAPANTITTGARPSRGRFAHPEQDRGITLREALRLQSFPDWWRFPPVGNNERFRLVGEAVPPVLAYRIAVHIGKLMGWEVREPPRPEEWGLPYFARAFADYVVDLSQRPLFFARGLQG